IGLILHALAAFHTSTWRWGTSRSSLHNILDHAGRDLARWILMLAFMPVEALVALDAVGRTFYRLSISRRNLLEWSTAAEVARDVTSASSEAQFWRRMWAGPAWAAINVLLLLAVEPVVILPAALLLTLWALSPAIAFRVSQREKRAARPLREEDRAYLRRIARGTWGFFERQVGPATHWLPPDNIQLEPSPQTAQQTSPTNIGFALLSASAAFDLGYTGTREFVYNLHHSLETIVRLPKYRGHLYNWYSIADVQPLAPRYVSTVDSGNLVAVMIAVRQSLLEIQDSPVPLQAAVCALEDDLGLMREKLDALHNSLVRHEKARSPTRLFEAIEDIAAEIK
ncbi:MAG: cyclic beta 1-2 glucan synthetase, partial [Woeseiaceae bacterium]